MLRALCLLMSGVFEVKEVRVMFYIKNKLSGYYLTVTGDWQPDWAGAWHTPDLETAVLRSALCPFSGVVWIV